MAQNFQLRLDTTAPLNGQITVLSYYKDNNTPISLSANDATWMKVWINNSETGAKTDDGYVNGSWIAYSTSWIPNFTTEGTNYVHAVFRDEVNNEGNVVNSLGTIFDKTAPTVTGVTIDGGKDVTVNRQVVVRVTANDTKAGTTTSGIASTTLSGDLDASSSTVFVWTDTDRTNGYKDCTITLSPNTNPSHRESKTVYAIATDRADNVSERNSDIIILYTGGVDPVLVLKDMNGKVIGDHYGESEFELNLQVLTGISDMINGYKVWGDFADSASQTLPTPEPSNWTAWTEGETTITLDKYLTASDGNKTIYGAVRLVVSNIEFTFPTYADLEQGVEVPVDGGLYKVTADETHENRATVYRYNSGANEYQFYGYLEDDDGYAYHNLESVSLHHSEAQPIIALTSAETVISDKTGHNSSVLTAAMTTSCNISEYKVVAYATQAAAQAGTYADAGNVQLSGTTEIPSGSSWQPTLLESNLVLAIPNEGQKFLVVYAKNLCDKWGKSNVISINVDLTAPTGNIVVNQYYNEVSGFTSSATDTGSSVAKMQAWVDGSQSTDTPPATSTEYDYAPNVTSAQVDWTNVVEGNNYVHIKYTDAVGNSAIVTSNSFIYDTIAPIECSVTAPAESNTTTITITLSASDVNSGMGSMKIYGDVSGASTAEQAQWIEYSATASITLTNGDGNKTINVLFKDNAGNSTTSAVTATCKLDTEGGSPSIVLYNNADTQLLGNYTNVVDFKAHISAVNAEDIPNIAQYKVWGNITEAATEQEATWKTFTLATGQDYMSVGLALTTGDGAKSVNVKLKDTAGNESTVATAVTTLDTTIPVMTVSGVDYDIISKVHEARLSGGIPVTGTFSDKMTFSFVSDSKLVQYKVCVYEANQQAATAIAIGTTGGSINMTGTNLNANTPVNCTIMGADYAAHPVIDDTDGAYWVVVYGLDEANNWSAVPVIA